MSSRGSSLDSSPGSSPSPLPFRRVAIIGVGLLGGSLAAALKAGGHAQRLVGIGRDDSVARCVALGLVDEAVTLRADDPAAVARALAGADLVVLAAPVSINADLMPRLAQGLEPDAILTDVSSVKSPVIAAARAGLGQRLSCFVPSHPIAGGEKTGPEAARVDLFNDRLVVLSPLAESDPLRVARLDALWQALGGRTRVLSPEEHDRIYALVSHWPHALAYALAGAVAADPAAADGFAGPGLIDQTRTAASSPELWAAILLANRDASLAAAATVRRESDRIEAALRAGDRTALLDCLTPAATWRRSLD